VGTASFDFSSALKRAEEGVQRERERERERELSSNTGLIEQEEQHTSTWALMPGWYLR